MGFTTWNGPKVLLLDIETAPMTAFVWKMWKEYIGVNQIESDWYILCWAAKWLNEDIVYSDSLVNYKKQYKANPENDKKILESLWRLLDAADIVVTHNGNRFDIKKLNSRFLMNNMLPPSPYRSIDTYVIAKTVFSFSSNKLQYLAKFLGVGEKIDTGGFDLWSECIHGNLDSWSKMIEYNENDIIILEGVYNKLKPWAKTYPNFSVYDETEENQCRICGSSNLKKNGFRYTNNGKYQAFRCRNCGAFSNSKKNLLFKGKREKLLS